jgi:hypothetical protein
MVTRLAVMMILLAGCASDDLLAPRPASTLDPNAFRCDVEPVLVARCAFFACHGSGQRPFRVYAPNRLRLDVAPIARNSPLTADEEAANLTSASGFTGDDSHPPLLLLKPLDVRAKGYFHEGQDLYKGDDVFLTTNDVGYQRIAMWIQGATEPAGCTPNEAVGP